MKVIDNKMKTKEHKILIKNLFVILWVLMGI